LSALRLLGQHFRDNVIYFDADLGRVIVIHHHSTGEGLMQKGLEKVVGLTQCFDVCSAELFM
jgi:hypothetical protein